MSPSQGWRRGAILILVPAIAIIVNLILAKRVSLRDSHSLASMAFALALNTEYRLAFPSKMRRDLMNEGQILRVTLSLKTVR